TLKRWAECQIKISSTSGLINLSFIGLTSGCLESIVEALDAYNVCDEEKEEEEMAVYGPPERDYVDYIPAFLTQREADELFAFLQSQTFVNGGLSYGPQVFPIAARNTRADVWATNTQPEPIYITQLRERMSLKYGIPFNSVQCNLHTGKHLVAVHADTYGVTAIIRVGAERVFEVGGVPYRGTPFT